jgi:hypothetical protein
MPILVNSGSGTFTTIPGPPHLVNLTMPFTPTDGNFLWLAFVIDTSASGTFGSSVFAGSVQLVGRGNSASTSSPSCRTATWYRTDISGPFTSLLTWTLNVPASGTWYLAEYADVNTLDATVELQNDGGSPTYDTTVTSDPMAVSDAALVIGAVGAGRNTATFTPEITESWTQQVDQAGTSATRLYVVDKTSASAGNETLNGVLSTETPWALVLDSFKFNATFEKTASADMAVADTAELTTSLEVYEIAGVTSDLDAFVVANVTELTSVLRVVVGATETHALPISVTVGEEIELTVDADVNIDDTVTPVIEPNPLVTPPYLVLMDVETGGGLHANAIRSTIVDFEAAGAQPGDIFEITSGQNVGVYIVRSVDGSFLFLEQVVPVTDSGVTAELRRPVGTLPYGSAALIISQPQFDAGFAVVASLDVQVA